MKTALLEAIATCLRDEAHIECECNYQTAEREGAYHSVCTAAYGGRGGAKNLASVFAYRDLVVVYIPRIKTLGEFQQRYGFPASKIMSDVSTNTPNKPYHCVEIDSVHFDPLTKGGDSTLIRRFLITAVRGALALRGISPDGRAKLQQTAHLVIAPVLQVSNTPVVQSARAPNTDPYPAFTKALVAAYNLAKQDTHYKSPLYLQMLLDRYGYDTAIHLICTHKPADGFTYLWEHKRLDLTVEAYVLRPEWSALFSDEVLRAARRRLEDYKYVFPDNLWEPNQSGSPTPLPPPTPPAPDLTEGPADRVKTT